MTAFYKIVSDNIIAGFGTNGSDEVTGITEAEYDELRSMFRERPGAPEGYACVLRDDPREWALVEVPIEDGDLDDAQALAILMGGAE